MYIATVPNRKSPPAILLRESYREDGKVRTRTIANLTHWEPTRIEAMRLALKGEFDGLSGAPECGPIFGVTFALKQLIDQVGITRALGKSNESKLTLFMIISRIAHGGSRLSAVRWSRQHCLEDIIGLKDFDENDLYNNLDWLAEQQDKIEQKLYKDYVKRTGKPPVIVLYDVTSSYFEGQFNDLACYGYNRDKKNGKKQVVIGLLTAEDGEPLAIRAFEGNTSDTKTVPEQIELLKENFGVNEVIFVGDRGMVKSKQKKQLNDEIWSYITALTKAQIRTLIKKDVIQGDLFDKELSEVECDNHRYIMRCNETRRDEERSNRQSKIERLKKMVNDRNEFVGQSKRSDPEAGLKKLQRWIKSRKLSSFITLNLEDKTIIITLDNEAMNRIALLDGCYTLETNVKTSIMDKETVNARYGDLQKVERNFRTIKTGLLEVRPIFLRNGQRTKAHIFIAMLALKVTRHFEKLLFPVFEKIEKSDCPMTIDDALLSLSRLTYQIYHTNTQSVSRLPKPDQEQMSILKALGIKFPKNKKIVTM
ncbi:MAG: IS1634 family transposase [Bacteroidota bacterium]